MKLTWTVSLIVGALMGGLISCGGGGSTATTTTPAAPVVPPAARTTGIAVPTEVSPVSTGTTVATSKTTASAFGRALAALVTSPQASATDAGTDYSKAQTVRYVSEPSINQFAIIETILDAVAQTHYADAVNIGAGPYKSIVSWQQEKQGGQSMDIQTWVVESSLTQVAGQDVNVVDCWIEDSGQLIRAQFKISAAATQAVDGSYLDYGVWTLNVKFDQAGDQYFVADASIDSTGAAVVAINEYQMGGGNNTFQTTQAVMHKSATTGYGKVYYPNQSDNSNTTVQTTAAYVYDAGQLLVHQTVPPAPSTYQDRTSSVPITAQYGLYDSVTGADVMTTHSFGFPVSFTLDGATQYGCYGANQGSEQLWINSGATIPDGTTVTRQDQGASGDSYQTVSFNGTLVKRTYRTGTISDLLNIPVQTNVNFQHQLTWSAAQSQCQENNAAFTDFASLAAQPQKMVWISAMVNNQPANFLYDPANASGAGFYPATMGNNGTMTPTPNGSKYVPTDGAQLWINISGSIYIEYEGPTQGWFQKTVTSFNQNTWTPTFDPAGDTAYSLGLNVQYFINNQGGNFIVTQTAASPAVYDVEMEVQTPANPVNFATVLGGSATFRPQNFDAVQSSTYQFATDPTSAHYLMLVYKTVGAQDAKATPPPAIGAVVSQSQYSLEAYDAQNNDLVLQYDWNYPGNGNNMGVQTFLYTTVGSTRTYKLLDNAIQLAPLNLTVNGTGRTLSLQYNGWLSGLPDYSSDLAMDNYLITPDIANKIINIPAGTLVTDQLNPAQSYLLKPLQIGLFLPAAATADASLDITAADALNLGDPTVIPAFVDNGMGAEPTVTVVSYANGVKVQ